MSPMLNPCWITPAGAPRVSGDEPLLSELARVKLVVLPA